MFTPQPVLPVKLFVAVLWADTDSLQRATEAMIRHWGAIDFTGPNRAFDATDYYEAEMGSGLQRRLVGFDRLVSPEILAEAKLDCNQIELGLSDQRRRRVNLDIGYLDHNKLVLASLKPAGQKIYLTRGIYADLVARYRSGRYCPFEWTFPDFRNGRYDADLAALRQRLLDQRRSPPAPPKEGGAESPPH